MVRYAVSQVANTIEPFAHGAPKKRIRSPIEDRAQMTAPQVGLVLGREEADPESQAEIGDDVGRAGGFACDSELRF